MSVSHRRLIQLALFVAQRWPWVQRTAMEFAPIPNGQALDGFAIGEDETGLRACVIEAKRDRSDLLHDLHMGKMASYALFPAITECVLVANAEALGFGTPIGALGWTDEALKIAIQRLILDGLPPWWGVILVGSTFQETRIVTVRKPIRHDPPPRQPGEWPDPGTERAWWEERIDQVEARKQRDLDTNQKGTRRF